MSLATALKTPRRFDPRVIPAVGALALVALLAATGGLRLLGPVSLDPVMKAPVEVRIHLLCALFALVAGAVQLARRKGGLLHKVLGWAWVLLMFGAAASSLLIRVLIKGSFSPIHLLSLFVLYSLPRAILAARRGDMVRHASTMRGLYWTGLATAGLFTLLPGRLLHFVLFGG